jgi:hypothetical protein
MTRILSLFVLLAVPGVLSDKREITILHRDTSHPNQYALMPHLSPVIFVRQIEGHSLTEKRDLLCHWSQEIDPKTSLPNVIGNCAENIKLVITGIDLNY